METTTPASDGAQSLVALGDAPEANQTWRTQPEIDAARQQSLHACLATPVDIGLGRYPFAGLPLTRADVEWLLAKHEDGRGPVIWADEPIHVTGWGVNLDHVRWGLDLRGARLTGVSLRGLPLARVRCGLSERERLALPFSGQAVAAARAACDLREADLRGAHLEGGVLAYCALDGADLRGAFLERATVEKANAPRTDWRGARLDLTDFSLAALESASLGSCDLRTSRLLGAKLDGADLSGVNMEDGAFDGVRFREVNMTALRAARATFDGSTFVGVTLRDADLRGARLTGARLGPQFDWSYVAQAQRTLTNDLTGANLQDAKLDLAQLQGVSLKGARLDGVSLVGGHLEGADLSRARLDGCDLRRATFDSTTNLQGATFGSGRVGPTLFGVSWNDADLSAVDWSRLKRLGDEPAAINPRSPEDRIAALAPLELAVRAYRQHTISLRSQGLSRQAAPFDYRAQSLQRRLFWRRMRWQGDIHLFGAWFFSLFLGGLTGYGYRMWRVLLAYTAIITVCAALYLALALQAGPHLSPAEALLVSVTAFHGRVFSEQFGPGSPQLWVTAIEAIAGVIVEGAFIAMLTQRLFDR